MKNPPQISDAEWEVMEVIWSKSPLTANEIVEDLSKEKKWHAQTIRTMLNRLVKKKALNYEQQGKRYLYRPNVSQDKCVAKESRSFLERVFGGATPSMIAYFVKSTKLSSAEVEELKQILNKKDA
jgi:BlaI family transcriptional regulator, penicillinase repressor